MLVLSNMISRRLQSTAGYEWNKAWYYPDIPPELREKIRTYFGAWIHKDELAAFIDTSRMHTADSGIVFTRTGLCWSDVSLRRDASKKNSVRYTDICEVTLRREPGNDGIDIETADGGLMQIRSCNLTGADRKRDLRYLLYILIEFAERDAFVALRKSSGEEAPALPGVSESGLRPGDILRVRRGKGMLEGLYYHFGVYIGDGKVIHYAAKGSDFSGEISIHEAPLSVFQGYSDYIEVLEFPDDKGRRVVARELTPDRTRRDVRNENILFELIRNLNYHLYTPEETVARAKSRLGESKYFLPTNNCEHFALWCKTGVHESYQVNSYLSILLDMLVSRKLPARTGSTAALAAALRLPAEKA